MNTPELDTLLDAYLKGQPMSKAELDRLIDLATETNNQPALDILMRGHWDQIQIQKKAPVRRLWIRYAAAAAVLVVVATTYLLTNKESQALVAAKIDVPAPDKNRAQITLGNGKTIYLDSVAAGQTIEVDGARLTKQADGRIVYSGDATTVAYNTASNPRGSKVIDLELNDHSHVWLNAGSSITYPVSGETRKVSITGEAYFEVAHDASRPFIVSKGETSVQVLGTHFDVKAYDNDQDIKVTLLEGSVNVKNKISGQILKPGQQAIVANDIKLIEEADLELAMAWKNGFTSFHSADLKTVLKELERWYDISSEIKGEPKLKSFFTEAPRTASLQDVLTTLFDNNKIVYEYDSKTRKLTILP